jgi:hypothetical protein
MSKSSQNPAKRREKLGDSRGYRLWSALETPGDVRRFLAWVVRSMRNGNLNRADAAVFGQLGNALTRAVDVNEVYDRALELEGRVRSLVQRAEAAQARVRLQ